MRVIMQKCDVILQRWLVTCLCLICGFVLTAKGYAESWQVKLPVQLNQPSPHQLIPIPKSQQYFLFNHSGDIHFLDTQPLDAEPFVSQPVLSLKQQLNNEHIELMSVALHPSFSMESKQGYNTFYVAYKAPFNPQSATVRLAQQSSNSKFDIVISEWVYLKHSGQVANNSQREIFRIATNSDNFSVKHLSFNPYVKPWQDDYGLLHVLLSQIDNESAPIFSGSLLRINPAPFGLKQYTVPMGNPYQQKSNILPEVVLYNINKPQTLYWQKSSHHDLLIHQRDETQGFASSVSLGDNMLAVKPEYRYPISQKEGHAKELHYFGSNKVDASPVYLALDGQAKELVKLSFVDNTQQLEPAKLLEKPLKMVNAKLLGVYENLAVLYTVSNQALHFITLQAHSEESDVVSLNDEFTAEQSRTSAGLGPFFYLTLFIFIVLAVWLNREAIIEAHAKRKIRQQFGNASINDGFVCLYKRHNEEIAVSLNSNNIVLSEMLLNQQVISQVDAKHNAFTNDTECDVKGVFNREYHLKMYGKRVRQIQLQLTDNKGKKYLVCPYFRIGDQRYTKLHFKPSLALLLDFQWQISALINPNNTPERKPEVVLEPEALKPVNKVTSEPSPISEPSVSVTSEQVSTLNTLERDTPDNSVGIVEESVSNVRVDIQDTKIIDALEKLVKLHQQGFIDDTEFSQAKSKLLQSLVDP